MPTTAQNVYGNQGLTPYYSPEEAYQEHVKLATGTYVRGTVLGEISASPGNAKAYASGSSDGSQIPKWLLAYDVVVDGSGNHSIGGADQGITYPSAPAFMSGYFSCGDITGLDATAITNSPSWKLIHGSTTAGVLRIG